MSICSQVGERLRDRGAVGDEFGAHDKTNPRTTGIVGDDPIAIESEDDSSGAWAQAVVQRPRRKACAASTTPHATPAFPRVPSARIKELPARSAHRRRESLLLGPPRPASLPRLHAASASVTVGMLACALSAAAERRGVLDEALLADAKVAQGCALALAPPARRPARSRRDQRASTRPILAHVACEPSDSPRPSLRTPPRHLLRLAARRWPPSSSPVRAALGEVRMGGGRRVVAAAGGGGRGSRRLGSPRMVDPIGRVRGRCVRGRGRRRTSGGGGGGGGGSSSSRAAAATAAAARAAAAAAASTAAAAAAAAEERRQQQQPQRRRRR